MGFSDCKEFEECKKLYSLTVVCYGTILIIQATRSRDVDTTVGVT